MEFTSSHDYKSGHSIELLRSGEQFFAEYERRILEATQFIHFQTYIVDDDETGRRIIDALIKAAGRGVRVYFLLDAFGSSSFSKELITEVEEAGILFRKFSPVFISKGFQMS
jgi:cardiolipin synthase